MNKKFLYVVSDELVVFLRENGFNCLQYQLVDNKTVYVFPYNDKLLSLVDLKFAKTDYYIGSNKLNF